MLFHEARSKNYESKVCYFTKSFLTYVILSFCFFFFIKLCNFSKLHDALFLQLQCFKSLRILLKLCLDSKNTRFIIFNFLIDFFSEIYLIL